VDKYVPVRVGASELERIEKEKSGDAPIQSCGCEENGEVRQVFNQIYCIG
jgi:hypothetical protein